MASIRTRAAARVADAPSRRLALLTALHFGDDLYQGAVLAILPFIALTTGLNYAGVAGLVLAATGLSAILQPVVGWAVDRFGWIWLAPLGAAVSALGMGLVGLATDYPTTAVALAISGAGVAAFHPSGATDVRRTSGGSVSWLSIFATGGTIGYASGPILMLPVVLLGDRHLITALAIPGVLFAIYAGITLRRGAAAGADRRPTAPRVDDWHSFAIATVIVLLRSIVSAGTSAFLVLFAVREVHLPAATGSILLGAYVWSNVAGTLIGGWLGHRIGRVRVSMVGLVFSAIGLVALVSAPAFLPVIVVVLGTAMALPFASLVTLGQDFLPNRVGSASGITLGIAISFGGFVVPALGGIADQVGLDRVFLGLAALALVTLVICRFLPEPPRGGRLAEVPTVEPDA